MPTYIKTIQDKDGNYILPRTSGNAVTVNGGGNLDKVLGAINAKLSGTMLDSIGNKEVVEFPAGGNIITKTYDASDALLKTSTTSFPAGGNIEEIVVYADGVSYKNVITFDANGNITTTVQAV